MSHPDQPCMQEKILTAIHKHPSCLKSRKDATFFDFAVFELRYPFDISGYTYRTATFPMNPLELIGLITYLDETPKTVDCLLPRFRNQNEKPPRFNWKTFVQAVPFHSTCVELLCEKDPDDRRFSEMCRKRFGQRANCTMLCMRNRNEENITLGVRDAYWYAGAPLTCNGTAYGIAAQPKIRHNFARPPSYDIHFVVTFIRCWIWLGQQIIKHTPKWKDIYPVYVQDLTVKPVSIPSPNTPFPPTRPYYFYEWDETLKGKNNANSPIAYFKHTFSHIILSLLISNHR